MILLKVLSNCQRVYLNVSVFILPWEKINVNSELLFIEKILSNDLSRSVDKKVNSELLLLGEIVRV